MTISCPQNERELFALTEETGQNLTFNICAVAKVIRESFRLRRPAFVPQSRDYGVSSGYGHDK